MVNKAQVDAMIRRETIGSDIAALWLKGLTQREIGEKYGLTVDQVADDIAWVRSVWRKTNERSITEKIDEELERLNQIEKAAWMAWEESRQDAVERSKSTEKGKEGKVTKKGEKRSGQAGDSRFLVAAIKCVQERCKLIGAYKEAEKDENEAGRPMGVLVVVDSPEEAQKMLSYADFEEARAKAEAIEADDVRQVDETE